MIRILNDTHLGSNAGAHTTHNSSKLLDAKIYENAMEAVSGKQAQTTVVHGGDLFDKYSNKEEVILSGLAIARHCDVIVGANHDLSNRANAESSIAIVDEVFGNVCKAQVNEVVVEDFESECGATFTVIPHHSSQDLFDKAVDRCLVDTDNRDLLFLHCNFNSPFAQNDSSLNVTPEQCEALLANYRYIILAHEHNHRWEMGGRLLVTGNTHPTNFGDVADKFFWDYNQTTKEIYSTKVWDKSEKYLRLSVNQLLSGEFSPETKDFIEVVGTNIAPDQAPDISQALQSIWQSCPNLLMLRNNVTYKTLSINCIDTSTQLEDVTKAISKDLEGSDLHKLWVETLNEVCE